MEKRLTDYQIYQRFGLSPSELRFAASRERAAGNNLVAACLTDVANGIIPAKKVKKENVMFQKIKALPLTEKCGWGGMILVQSATLPVTLGNILGLTNELPPLSMVLLVWAGLALYFVRAFAQKDKLYMVSNGLGFILNSVLIALIALPWF